MARNKVENKKKKRNRKRKQVTCICGAYSFPHRLGGTKCSGSAWARSYWEIEGKCCVLCSCERGGACSVMDGREDVRLCEGRQEHELHGSSLRHPVSVEDHMAALESWAEVQWGEEEEM